MPVPFFLVVERTNNLAVLLAWTGISTFFIFSIFYADGVLVLDWIFSDLDVSKRQQRQYYFWLVYFWQ